MTDTVESRKHTLTVDRPPPETDTGFTGLIALIALVVALGFAFGFSWVVVIATLVVIIFLHELGHYLTARSAGMKVTEFFLFFGPRIWSFRRGETEYGIKTVPLGAYVKIIGMTNLEEVDPADEDRTYREQPYWRRLSVAVAGSAMHFLIAGVALFAFLVMYGDLVADTDEWQIGAVTDDSAAARAELEPGDRLLAIDGVDTTQFDELGDVLEPFAGESVTLTVERDGATFETVTVIGERLTEEGAATIDGLLPGDVLLAVGEQPVFTYDELVAAIGTQQGEPVAVTFTGVGSADPQTADVVLTDPISAGASRGFLGVSPEAVRDDYSVIAAVPRTVSQFTEFSWLTIKGIGEFFWPPNFIDFVSGTFSDDPSELVTSETTPLDADRLSSLQTVDPSEPRVLSPYGLVQFGNSSAESGFEGWLAFLIVINISIGIVNLIPLLPFDGGHVVIATYEKIRSMASG
ncbi:MAG: site-2 protease family protein, partial [Acidimicrobiales bacterium]